MSAPINIRGAPAQTLIAELFHFPPSPPFASERHACAFPSWPDRPTLCSQPSVSSQGSNNSGFWSDVDLLVEPKISSYKPFQRIRPVINFNDIEFEDDSDDDEDSSAESSLSSTPEVQPIKIAKASFQSKSILGDQIRRQRDNSKKTLAQLISE